MVLSFPSYFYLPENDGVDGEDLICISSDIQELRHYFPVVKERLKLKKMLPKSDDIEQQDISG